MAPGEAECPGGGGQCHPSGANYDTSVAAGSQAVLAPHLEAPSPTAPPRPKATLWGTGGCPRILLPRTQLEDGQGGHRRPQRTPQLRTHPLQGEQTKDPAARASGPCASRATLPDPLPCFVSRRVPSYQTAAPCWIPRPLSTWLTSSPPPSRDSLSPTYRPTSATPETTGPWPQTTFCRLRLGFSGPILLGDPRL